MKKLITTIIAVSVLSSGISQTIGDDIKQMIDSSISLKLIDFYKWRGQTNVPKIYIIYKNDCTYQSALPKEVQTICITCIDRDNILKEGDIVWKVVPELNGLTMSISIINYLVASDSDRKKGILLGKEGSSKIIFIYSSRKRKWIKKDYINYGH